MPTMPSKNSSGITNEPWFLPVDIIMNISIRCVTILVTIFFFVILLNKTCRIVPMLLVGNTCFIGIFSGAVVFWMSLLKLINDYQQIAYEDIFCQCREYIGYTACSIFNFSFLTQAFYRFMRVVYQTRLTFQSWKFQLFLIVITRLFCILFPVVFLFIKKILYDPANQICQLPLRFSFAIIYMALCVYMVPVS